MNKIQLDGYKRISLTQAKKYYNDGLTIYILGANLRPGNMYEQPLQVNKERFEGRTLDNVLNEVKYYNYHWKGIWYWVKEGE